MNSDLINTSPRPLQALSNAILTATFSGWIQSLAVATASSSKPFAASPHLFVIGRQIEVPQGRHRDQGWGTFADHRNSLRNRNSGNNQIIGQELSLCPVAENSLEFSQCYFPVLRGTDRRGSSERGCRVYGAEVSSRFPRCCSRASHRSRRTPSNTLSLWVGTAASSGAYRNHLKLPPRIVVPLLIMGLVGGVAGALLLIKTPAQTFLPA